MLFEIAADITALAHLTFILFVIFGAALVHRSLGRRRRVWMALHLASMAYGVMIEVFYWYCPLTVIEQFLRRKAGRGEYNDAFIAHYVNKLVYLDAPQWSLVLAAAIVLVGNLGIYFYWWRRAGRPRPGFPPRV